MSELVSYPADELLRQMKLVSDTEVAADSQHRHNILTLTASPEEVEDWYFAVDPIDETHHLVMDTVVAQHDRKALEDLTRREFERFVALVRGGTTLLASNLFPALFGEDGGRGWHKTLSEIVLTPDGELSEDDKLLSTAEVLSVCDTYIRNTPTTFAQGELPRVFRAAEMLRSGATNLFQYANTEGLTVDNRDGSSFDEIVYNSGMISESLLRYLTQYGVQEVDPVTGEDITPQTRMLALRAATLIGSAWMSHAENYRQADFAERADEEFATIVKLMQQMFDDPNMGLAGKLKTGDVKGPLHEALWILDAYVLRKTKFESYGDISVTPAYSSGDAPRVGHPELRRGYDVLVRNMRLGTRDYIQLKAGNGGAAGRPYHPAIWELREPNFMEVNPRRLSRKLHVYAEWAKSGFAYDQVEAVSKYVMKSVRWELDSISRDKLDRTTALRKFFMEHFIAPGIEKERRAKDAANPFVKPTKPDISL
jgi:hypothetical protein